MDSPGSQQGEVAYNFLPDTGNFQAPPNENHQQGASLPRLQELLTAKRAARAAKRDSATARAEEMSKKNTDEVKAVSSPGDSRENLHQGGTDALEEEDSYARQKRARSHRKKHHSSRVRKHRDSKANERTSRKGLPGSSDSDYSDNAGRKKRKKGTHKHRKRKRSTEASPEKASNENEEETEDQLRSRIREQLLKS